MTKIPLKRPKNGFKPGFKGKKGQSSSFRPLEPGKYRVRIESAEEAKDDYAGLYLNLRVLGGEYRGRTLRVRAFPGTRALASLAELLEAHLGIDFDESREIDVNLEDFEGIEAYAQIGRRKAADGRVFNKILEFYPLPKSTSNNEDDDSVDAGNDDEGDDDDADN